MRTPGPKPRAKTELTDQEKLFIETQNHCALCGTHLEIKVESYLEDFYLREEAHCPDCQIVTRNKNHRMH